MTNELRVAVELGPKGKKHAVYAPDWPGLERGEKTVEAALARLDAYRPRYAQIAKIAGMEKEFAATTTINVVEEYTGPGSTDFWGISFGHSSIDNQPVSPEELERELKLLQACWTFFDSVRFRVSAEMQKGPRGGGRDRDQIVRHLLANEMDWASGLGVPNLYSQDLTEETISTHRDAMQKAIREAHAEGKKAKKWSLRYLIRHSAYHTMDHAWEMEDKDLTGKSNAT